MSESLVLYQTADGVTTLTMNMPKRLNGWTAPMMLAMRAAFTRAAADEATQAIILTGADPYYCAGVNLGAAFRPAHPRTLRSFIEKENQALFDMFLDFPKPILAAVNGPALGASVTSAALCDQIVASDKGSFSTPFGELGIPPEGCSSVMFPRLLGAETAQRILGAEGWKPTAAEAQEIGLVEAVFPHDQLLVEAQRIAAGWVAEGRGRRFRGGFSREALKAVNVEESAALASAFLHPRFLGGRFRFFWRKNKRQTALMFLTLRVTHPVWSLML